MWEIERRRIKKLKAKIKGMSFIGGIKQLKVKLQKWIGWCVFDKRSMEQSLTNNRSMKENQKVKMQGAKEEERWRDAGSKGWVASFVFRGKLI